MSSESKDRYRRDRVRRLALWAALCVTADANRRHFRLTTTWLPHLLGNSAALFLPELVRATDRTLDIESRLVHTERRDALALVRILQRVVVANPDYGAYVAPVALAYIVSHPHFNIYRGRMAEIRLAGFGLDALPHAASAYTLSGLLYDAVDAARGPTDALGADSPPAGWSSHAVATTGGLLALLTAIYESGEYVIHRYELAKAGGDPDGINMLWSLDDTVHDVVSNAVGWLAATLRR